MNRNIKYIITFCVLLTFFGIFSTSAQDEPELIVRIDAVFVSQILKTLPIDRDDLIDSYLEKIVVTKGYVERVIKKNIYKQQYCIELIDSLNNSGMNFKFHLYTENSEFSTLLDKGDLFEFKGQLVMYTPASLKKDIYVLDIILEDGALVVE